MICTEEGVLPGSKYFFFAPSDMFKKYYYYLLNCGKFICREGYRIKRNGYISPLIIYVKRGTLFLHYECKNYTVNKDEVMLIDCNNPHEYYCKAYCEFLYFHFDGCNAHQITNHLISQNGGAVFRLENSQAIHDNMEQILSRLYAEEYPSDTEMSCAVYNTLCSIQALNEILPVASSPTSNTMTSVINFIKSNIDENFTLDMLADHVNLSKYYFSHLFKEETGLSPMEYIAHLKVNLAKTILKTTTRTVEDIAISLGYSSSASFINAFSARVGMSPNKYRQAPLFMNKPE